MSEIPALLLLPPEFLPQSYDDICAWRTESVSEALYLSLSRSSNQSGIEKLAAIRAALRALPNLRQVTEFGKETKPLADRDSHDHYCRIYRARADDLQTATPLEIYTHSILSAYEEFVEDSISGSTSLSEQQWNQLRVAFDSMLGFLGGSGLAERGTAVSPLSGEWDDIRLLENEQLCDPLGRWIRGHHVFLALIQCVVTSLNCFFSAHQKRQSELGALALDLTTTLFDGCSVALHFAGDFSSSVYKTDVRPTMMPPQVLPGMSGVLARDHEYLVRLLRNQRQVFRILDPALKEGYMRLVCSFENTYEAHKLVCSHFVGDEVPSLLSRNEHAEAAVDVLDKVKNLRLRSFH